jgi:hypothetical protein
VPGQPAPRRTTGDFALRRHQPVVVVIAAMPRRAAWGLTPADSHRAMNYGGTSTSRTLGGLSMTAFLDSPDARRGRRWRVRHASRAGASRFTPQLAPTLTRRARCDTGATTGHTSRYRFRAIAQGGHSAHHCDDEAVARNDRNEDSHHFTVSGGQDARPTALAGQWLGIMAPASAGAGGTSNWRRAASLLNPFGK